MSRTTTARADTTIDAGALDEAEFDIVIAGAGPAGTGAAMHLGRFGYRVLLCDQRPEDRIGGNPAVYDGITKEDWVHAGVPVPTGRECGSHWAINYFFSPDRKSVKEVRHQSEWFSTNRFHLGQRLLKYALDAGATFLGRTQATALIIEDDAAVGVELQPLDQGKSVPVRAKFVIDATGFKPTSGRNGNRDDNRNGTALQRTLPKALGLMTDYRHHVTCKVYREMRTGITEPLDHSEFYFGAGGNLGWVDPYPYPYPATDRSVYIHAVALDDQTDPRELLQRMLEDFPRFAGERVIATQYGEIPFGRCVHTFTSNGYIAIGDAAYQVNPINGCGVGSAMYAAKLAAEAIHHDRLWEYNYRYQRTLGARFAALDTFKRFATQLTEDELNFLFHNDLINASSINTSQTFGNVEQYGLRELVTIAPKFFTRIGLGMRLGLALNLVTQYQNHYLRYPSSPRQFQVWLDGLKRLDERFERLIGTL